MGLMPSSISGDSAAFGLKAICVFPGNPVQGKDAHPGAVLLFSAETRELLAMMNASAITAIRTAAVSGVAADLPKLNLRIAALWQKSRRMAQLIR
jgi:ornithine cyclodeaminase